MEHDPSREANSKSSSQEITPHTILLDPKDHYHVHNSLLLVLS